MIGKLTVNSDVGLLICLLTLFLAIFSLYWRFKYHIFHVKKQNIQDIYELRQKLPTLDTEPKFIQDMELGTIAMFQGLNLEQVKFLIKKNLSLKLMSNISLLMKHGLCRLEDNVLVIPKTAYVYKKYLFNIKSISALLCFLFFTKLVMEVIFSQNFSIIEYVCLLLLTLSLEFYLLLSVKGMIIYKDIIKMKQAVSDIELRAEDNFDGKLEGTKALDSNKSSWFKQRLVELKQKNKIKADKKVEKKEKSTLFAKYSAKNKAIVDEKILVEEAITTEVKTSLNNENKQSVTEVEDYLLESDEIDRQVQEDLQKIKLEEYQTALRQAQPKADKNDVDYQEGIQQPVAYENEVDYQEEIQQEQPVAYETETEYQYQEEIQQEQPVAYETETEYQYQEEIQQEQPVAYETEYQYQEEIQQEQPVTYETEEPLVYEEHELKYQANVQQAQAEQATDDDKDNFNLPF